MKTSYFTFCRNHVHRHNDATLDRDIVAEITAEDPRARAYELFGAQWCAEYDSIEAVGMEFYPRGIHKIQ